jgi:hypothetical protein
MLGLSTDAKATTLTFAPHLPADWDSLGINNLRVGENKLQLNFTKSAEELFLEARRTAGTGESIVEFRPSISLRATVQKVELNAEPLAFRVEANDEDQHVIVRFPVSEGPKLLRIFVSNDFAVAATQALPPLGSASTGVRILSETWSASRDQLTLDVSGCASAPYELKVWNAAQIERVDGAELKKSSAGSAIKLQMPASDSEPYVNTKVVFHFAEVKNKAKRR